MPKKKKDPFREKTCVAPVGLTMPNSQKRLASTHENMRKQDPEHIIMQLWEKENIRARGINFGLVPIDSILHTCNEECGKVRTSSGSPEHHFSPPSEDDVKIINATIQWLATNCGRCFLDKFLRELKDVNR